MNGPQLRRSARLRDLLLYIGRKSIREHANDLKEQDIGVAVFARPPAYDTGQDNIVRVNVTELRKRIDTYFLNEGATENLLLDIPRGSYSLDFRRPPYSLKAADASAATPSLQVIHSGTEIAEPVAASPASPKVPDAAPVTLVGAQMAIAPGTLGSHKVLIAILSAALFCCIAWSCWLLHRTAELETALQPWQSQPNLKLFWSPFLSSGESLDIVLGDTSLALAEDISRRPVPLTEYLSLGNEHYASDPTLSADQKRFLSLTLPRNNGSFSDFRVARDILSMSPGSKTIQLRSAREFSPDLLKTRRVILVGSRKSNPWVDLFSPSLDFRIGYDPDRLVSFVDNLQPGPGEGTHFEAPSDPRSSIGYSVIALLPPLTRGSDVLFIGGTDSQATEAAGEFVTNETSLAALRNRLGSPRFTHFQLLLRTSRLRGVPLTSDVVALHISKK